MRNIVLCILYLFLVPMGGFAQSEVIVLYPDTENKDLDEAVYQKIFLAGNDRYGEKCGLGQKATCGPGPGASGGTVSLVQSS